MDGEVGQDRFSPGRIGEKAELLEWKLELQARGNPRGRPIEDPTGWLIRAIEKDYQLPPASKRLPKESRKRPGERKKRSTWLASKPGASITSTGRRNKNGYNKLSAS